MRILHVYESPNRKTGCVRCGRPYDARIPVDVTMDLDIWAMWSVIHDWVALGSYDECYSASKDAFIRCDTPEAAVFEVMES